MLSLIQGAFPARLKKVLIVGAPVWFRVPYNLLSLLLKEKLRERVSRGEHWWFSDETLLDIVAGTLVKASVTVVYLYSLLSCLTSA